MYDLNFVLIYLLMKKEKISLNHVIIKLFNNQKTFVRKFLLL